MEGMSGHKHDDFAPHGAFLGHAVPVRPKKCFVLISRCRIHTHYFADLRISRLLTHEYLMPIAITAGELLHHLVQLVAVLVHAGAHLIDTSQTVSFKVRPHRGRSW